MAEFNLARLRYTWKNYWTGATTYVKDDIVSVGGDTYICMIGHTSDATTFLTDLNYTPKSYWLLHTEGYTWRGDWTVSTRYVKNDLLKYNGVIYRVLTEHVSGATSIAGDEAKLLAYAKTPHWRNEWLPQTLYRIDDVIRYNGIVYRCLAEHTSSTTVGGLEVDIASWELSFRGDNWRQDWNVNTRYKKDDIVRYGGIIYRAITGHTSAVSFTLGLENDLAKWEKVIDGIEWVGHWQSADDSTGTRYRVGDIVTWGPTLWRCKTAHTTTVDFNETYFDIWMPGLGFESVWNDTTKYQPGDIVQYGGYTYTSMTNNTNSKPSVTGVFYDGESLQGLYDWELLTTGYNMRGEWNSTDAYRTGDVVRRYGWVYIAVKDSTAEEPDSLDPELRSYYNPGETTDPNSVPMTWQLVNTGSYYRAEWLGTAGTVYVLGDIVVQKSTTYICVQRHESDDSTLVTPELDATNSYWKKLIQGSTTNVLEYKGDLRTHDGSNTTKLPIGSPGNALKVNAAGNSPVWEGLGEIGKVYFVSPSGKDAIGNGLSISAPFKSMKFACQYILADEANRAPGTIYVATGLYEEILPISIPEGITVWGDERRSVTIKPAPGYEGDNMWYVRNATGIKNMTCTGLLGSLGAKDVYGTSRPTGGAYFSLDPGTGPADSSVWITTKSPYMQNISSFGTGVTGLKIDGTIHNGGLKSMVANDVTNFLSDGISVWLNGDARAELVSVFTYFCHIGYLCTDGGKIRGTNGNNSYGTFGSAAIGTLASETPITAKAHNRYYGAAAPEVYNNANNIFAIGYTHTGQDYINANYTITGSGLDVAVDNTFTEKRNQGISELRLLDPGDSSASGGRGHLDGVRNSAQSGDTISIKIANSDINNASHYAGRAYLTFDTISAADPQRPEATYSNVPATTNGRGHIPQQAFTITIDGSGAATVITPLDGSHSHRVGDIITISNVNLGNVGGVPNLTFKVASISPGMRIFLEEGKGRGQYALIDEYFPATKDINVLRESDGKRGWDHIVPGWSIATVLDGTTTYRIEPRVTVADPVYSVDSRNTGVASTWRAGSGHGDTLVAFTDGTEKAVYSNLSGTTWTTAPTDANWVDPNCVLKSKGKLKYYIALGNGAYANLSTAGTAWGSTGYPIASANYVDICEGPHSSSASTVIAIADDNNNAQITTSDGTSWTASAITGGGTGFKWIAYGNGKWMTVKADGTAYQSINNGTSWIADNNVCPSTYNVTGFTYGNGRFIASCKPNGTFTAPFDPSTTMISATDHATTGTFGLSSTFFFSFTDYSTTATTSVWYESDKTMINDSEDWAVDYQEGVFVATSTTGKIRTGDGGHVWNAQSNYAPTTAFRSNFRGFTTSAGPGWWLFDTTSQFGVNHLKYGGTPRIRAIVKAGRIEKFLITEPGSGYVANTPPTVTIADTQKTEDASINVRINNGCLGQPHFKNRGAGYTKFNQVAITGDGFADQFQTGLHFVVKDLSLVPGPGDNLTFSTIHDVIYKVGSVETLSGSAPNITAKISLAPTMGNAESPAHEEEIIIRQRYSQVRLTGHDFLDVGTGNIVTTDYPKLYIEGYGSVYPPEQQNETIEYAGGRVFYTSTDQDGNFRVGELFKVEQSTGIVTINASQFDLSGLQELRLGALIVGGTQAVIREFSKESTFVANSNNIVPTQKAIASYISSRISGGGSNVAANAVLAGVVKLSNINQLSHTGGSNIVVDVIMHMKGVSGAPLAMAYFNNGIFSSNFQELYEDPDGHYPEMSQG
ncbi:MAG: hypothetical protein CMA31_02440 [Euryarchaeota archaeon]|nr:hypothetical protein [Euryarchaeota archaeon]